MESVTKVKVKFNLFFFFSMLVNIYGSKDLFVSEYRTLLADRILSTFNYATDQAVRICR